MMNIERHSSGHRSLLALTLGVAALAHRDAGAQGTPTVKVFFACYVPATGTVYRVKEPNTPTACDTKKAHVEFSWTDGVAAVRMTDAAAGDVTGTFGSLTVAKLLGRALNATPPNDGQVLQWDAASGSWVAKALPSGVTVHGQLSALEADDHKQYPLVDGSRPTVNGFAVTGVSGTGTIPASGPGVRLLWYPKKSAFRAGKVDGNAWDDGGIGEWSAGFGYDARASGHASTASGQQITASGGASTAFGSGSVASGDYSIAAGRTATAAGPSSIAMGGFTTAGGEGSTALGWYTTAGPYASALGINNVASGWFSTALGVNVTASGMASTALGRWASTNGHAGAFVYGDNSTEGSGNAVVNATAPNQFLVRASGGVFLRTSSDLSSGCDISAGNLICSGTVTGSSDRALKFGFAPVNPDTVLAKLAALPITQWQYKADPTDVLHVGPTAQDFRAAFGLGPNDRTISMVDADGVNMIAIQALEKRTREIATLRAATTALREENALLREQLSELLRRVEQLESGRRD